MQWRGPHGRTARSATIASALDPREEALEPFRAERAHFFIVGILLPHPGSRRLERMTETLDYADHDEDEPKSKSSRPSPEEGHRLVRLFLSVERADLREEIFNFVEGILRR
jgi:hypothetical protein